MPDNCDLTLFQKILLATDGTVTDLVALYAGEPIRVKKLDQLILENQTDAALRCAGPTRMLSRTILLCGASQNYLYAESRFVLERLPRWLHEQMVDTDRPLGLLWKEARLETFREIIDQRVEPGAAIASFFGLPASDSFVSRTYLVHHGAEPLGAVTEKWPLSGFRERML
jgi:chorismate-pyruvate lyase